MIISILGGKGGIGKTTVAINLASALNELGVESLVVDGNIFHPNIGFYLGLGGRGMTFQDALDGADIRKTIYRHLSGIKVIPGDINYRENVSIGRIGDVLKELKEVTLIDTASGITEATKEIIKNSDHAIIVTTPDIISVTDAMKMAKITRDFGVNVYGTIINRKKDQDVDEERIAFMIGAPVIGIISDDRNIEKAIELKYPIVYAEPNSPASRDFKKTAGVLIGDA